MARGKRRQKASNPADTIGQIIGGIIGTLIGLWFLYIVINFLWHAFWQSY